MATENGQESGVPAEKMEEDKADGGEEPAAAKPGKGTGAGAGAGEDTKMRSGVTGGEGEEEVTDGKKENGGGKEGGRGGGGQDEDEDEESVWMRTIRGRLMHIARTFAAQIYECHEVSLPHPPPLLPSSATHQEQKSHTKEPY